MINKLRLKLTILFSILICTLFIGMSLITWSYSCNQYRANFVSTFSSYVTSVCNHLSTAAILRDSWLLEQERGNDCIIYIEDSKQPLFYFGADQNNAQRSLLISLAKESTLINESASSNYSFPIKDASNNEYLCSYSKIMLSGEALAEVWIIKDYSPVPMHRMTTTFFYIGLDLIVCAILTFFSALMVRLSTAPVKESLTKQKEFIAAASHELRSPLTVMKANLDAVKTSRDEKTKQTLLDGIDKETERLKHLSNDLLFLTGADAGAIRVKPEPMEADTLFIEIFETYQSVCTRRNHSLKLLLPETELPMIHVDKERMIELFGILIHNALDYTPEETLIELKANASHQGVSFYVIDHGPGIPDSAKKNIFTRFYRADQSRTDKSHYGLGLSIAAEIAHAHSAALEIFDTKDGGATFCLHIKQAK